MEARLREIKLKVKIRSNVQIETPDDEKPVEEDDVDPVIKLADEDFQQIIAHETRGPPPEGKFLAKL